MLNVVRGEARRVSYDSETQLHDWTTEVFDVLLKYEDREQMQRSLRRAGLREVFVCRRGEKIRVTVLMDTRSMAAFEVPGGEGALDEETEFWRQGHFDVVRGEVTLNPAG